MYDDTQRQFPPTESDNGGQRPTTSDVGGHSPTMTDTVGAPSLQKKERSAAHILTTSDVAKRFEQAQLPRSQRSIERYCKAEQLDCYWDPLEKCYYITPESVRRLIGELKEIQARHVSSSGVGPGPSAADTPPAQAVNETANARKTGDETARGEREQAAYAAKLKEYEDMIFNLTVDNKAKEQVISQMRKFMQEDRTQLTAFSHHIGQLETRLEKYEQLPPPRQHILPTSSDRPTVHDAEFTDVEASARNPAEPSAPTPR